MPAKVKGRAKAAANHKLAADVPKGTEMTDLRKKSWFIGEAIGSGGFGLIYLGKGDALLFDHTKSVPLLLVYIYFYSGYW